MAGRDPVLAAWRARYDAVAAAQWAASVTAVGTLGAVVTKFAATADTYLSAEHAAHAGVGPARGAGGQGTRTPTAAPPRAGPAAAPAARPDGGGPLMQPGAAGVPSPGAGPGAGASSGAPGAGGASTGAGGPPSSTGAAGPDVPDALAPYFPGGDPEVLRLAAGRWGALAAGMRRIATTGDDTFRRLTAGGDGAAFSAMRTFWARRSTPCASDPLFNAVVNGAALGRARGGDAPHRDHRRRHLPTA